jgi:hypothetical protein
MRSWARLLALAALVCGLVGATPAHGARDNGSRALQRALGLFAQRQAAPAHPRSATLVLRDLAASLGRLTGAQRARAEALLARPDDMDADPAQQGYSVEPAPPFCTPHVCIHWVNSTADAPPPTDADANGLPDQVDLTARILEEVWQKEVVEYGYRPPKPDLTSPNHGPDERIDVYIADVGADGLYGYCTTDDPAAGRSPDGPWDVSAFCVLDNDYAPAQFPTGSNGERALAVTAAHEFFHAIQFAYDFLEDLWLIEGTAVWMEDEVYDDIDDNYQYLEKSALRRPDVPLDLAVSDFSRPEAGYQYGAFLFFRFLSESTGGPGVIRRIWEFADGSPAGPDQYSWRAIDSALRERGTSMRSAFARFGAVNEEGTNYPVPPIARKRTLSPRRPSALETVRLDHLTTWYGVLRPGAGVPANARLRIALDLPRRPRGPEATLILVPREGAPQLIPLALDAHGDATRVVRFAPSQVKAVHLVLSNASGRFRCWHRLPFTCSGVNLDDGQAYHYAARLLGLG